MAAQKKPATKPATKQKQTHEDPEAAIESALGRTENFIYSNGKMLLTVLAVVVLAIGAYMGYKHIYQANRAEKASVMMFAAQQNFQQEIYEAALNGDGNNAGFLDVISKYGNTPQGNVARHYAGICYVKAGDVESAMKYLSQYKSVKGAPGAVINAENLGLQGDMLVQQQNYDGAVDKYKKAVGAAENTFSTPLYLKKLGLTYVKLGRGADAEAAFQSILDEYPSSNEARDIEKYLGAAGQL